MSPKRRLPVLRDEPAEHEDGPPRSAWQWVGFGAVAMIVVWLPLSWMTALLVDRLGGLQGAPLTRALLFAGGVAVSGLAGGFLMGRWGPGAVGVREAALAGLSAAMGATVLAWIAAGFSPMALATVLFAVPPAALGGRVGMKRRSRA